MERLDRYAPPGMGSRSLRYWTGGMILLSMVFSLSFFMEYASEYQSLIKGMETPVYSGQTMPRFSDLIVFPMLLFRVAPAVPLLHIPGNYLYFTQETKSIYTMKRLKNNREMHLRCLLLPVTGMLLTIAAGAAVYLLYLLYYYVFTPDILLPAEL